MNGAGAGIILLSCFSPGLHGRDTRFFIIIPFIHVVILKDVQPLLFRQSSSSSVHRHLPSRRAIRFKQVVSFGSAMRLFANRSPSLYSKLSLMRIYSHRRLPCRHLYKWLAISSQHTSISGNGTPSLHKRSLRPGMDHHCATGHGHVRPFVVISCQEIIISRPVLTSFIMPSSSLARRWLFPAVHHDGRRGQAAFKIF